MVIKHQELTTAPSVDGNAWITVKEVQTEKPGK